MTTPSPSRVCLPQRTPLCAPGVLEGETSGYTVKNMEFSGDVKQCFHDPHFVVLHVQSDLRIITDGWTEIEEGMRRGSIFIIIIIINIVSIATSITWGTGRLRCQNAL